MLSSEINPVFSASWIEANATQTEKIDLSVIIPAYNEESRLPLTLIKAVDFLESRKKHCPEPSNYEILVVDDGSTDETSAVVEKFSALNSHVFLLRLPHNQGKGRAVQAGILNCRGSVALFMDADGATPMAELNRLLQAISDGFDLAYGSRALQDKHTRIRTVWYRKWVGRVFNFIVNFLLIPDVLDTQCGFKIFKAACAKEVFRRQTLKGFSFDVEILYIAKRLGFKAKEVAINWTNVPGSKVNLIQHSVKMFWELLLIKLRHG